MTCNLSSAHRSPSIAPCSLLTAHCSPRTGPAHSTEPILVKLAALHDDGLVLALLLQQPEIVERVAVYHEQVRVCARRERANLALHPQHARADGRGRAY